MAEVLTLSTPVNRTTTFWEVVRLDVQRKHATIAVELEGDNGEQLAHTWRNAQVLIRGLNKANLSVQSLEKRILLQLVTDGVLQAGSVTGAPD